MSTPGRPLSAVLAESRGLAVRRILFASAPGDTEPFVTGVVFDSRDVAVGSMFLCVRGAHFDGHDFAVGAVDAGAAVLVVDHELDLGGRATQVLVDDTRWAMGSLAAGFFENPTDSLTVVGVTGTNGKTTIVHILQCALASLGRKVGAIGTLSGAHTTPEAPELQQRLAAFRDAGCTDVAMEVSSHALALDRVVGVRFRIGVFTYLGRDHLDLHETQERYFAAKARLFEAASTDRGVVNVDDVHGRLLVDAAEIPMTTYSLADVTDLTVGPFEHSYEWRGVRIRVDLGGRFNVMNSLAAATTLAELGWTPEKIGAGLAQTTPVRGRWEPVVAGQGFAVVVDYAHTPDALLEVLTAAREIAPGHRLAVVFGCGGDRDREKRPQMGAAAAAVADLVVVTSDNPRSESPEAIINDIIGGVPASYRGQIAVEPDRRQAIAIALRAVGPGDVVVLAGKGHETTQTFRTSVTPFDDRAVARDLLEKML